MKVLLVFYLCVCLFLCFADDTVPPIPNKCKESGNELEITCQFDASNIQVEDKYECSCDFQVEEGYQIEVVVEKLNLNGAEQDSISIGTDNAPDEYTFTWFLEEEKRFLLLEQSGHVTFKTNCVQCTNVQIVREFTVRMKRYGELTTTAEPPTTPIDWPEPAENDTIFHIVNVTTSRQEFITKQDKFRIYMANITQEYCEKHKIPLVKNVTEENIIIDLAITCPVMWPNHEKCIQIRYAIPVFLENGTIPAYQLQLVHLKQIWDEFVKNKLRDLGWSLYEEPDNSSTTLIWLGISLVVLVIFLVFLLAIRKVGFLLKNHIVRKLSDTDNIMDYQPRASDTSLFPTSQVVPPLFEESVYSYYDPELNTSMKPPQVHNPTSATKMIDVDDLSDEDVMDVNNIQYDRGTKHSSVILDNPHAHESAL